MQLHAPHPHRPRIVLATFGTYGDLHPFLALALALRERGAAPVLAAGEVFRAKVEAEGIGFHPMRPDIEAVANRLALTPRQLARAVASRPQFLLQRILLPALRDAYDDAMVAMRGADLVVTHSVAYGAQLAAEKLGLPRVGIVLQPMLFASASDPPVIAEMPRFSRWIYRQGPVWTRAFLALGRRIARRWARPIDAFRREVGLPPATAHPLFEGQFTGIGAIGLYSPLLEPPRPEHPPHTTIAGFAFYDSEHGGASRLSPALQAFLDGGAPPVVFTQGTSAVHDADDFVRESLAAIDRLGVRAVLVLDEEQARRWSSHATATIHVTGYAPYSTLFPQAAINVHHGGIGTTAQALRAGRPQLVTPYLVDQPDNAARVVRLGVGRAVSRRAWRSANVAAALRALMDQPGYRQAAARVGSQVAQEEGARVAAEAILSLLGRARQVTMGRGRLTPGPRPASVIRAEDASGGRNGANRSTTDLVMETLHMPDISARSLVLIIQAVDREITRLMSLPDDAITPAEELRLVDYESLAHELEEAYASVTQGQTNLPAYERLVTHRGPDDD